MPLRVSRLVLVASLIAVVACGGEAPPADSASADVVRPDDVPTVVLVPFSLDSVPPSQVPLMPIGSSALVTDTVQALPGADVEAA